MNNRVKKKKRMQIQNFSVAFVNNKSQICSGGSGYFFDQISVAHFFQLGEYFGTGGVGHARFMVDDQ